jgi:hypothetical protein
MGAIIELTHKRHLDGIIIDAIATCSIVGSQKPHMVARVMEPDNPNPGIVFEDEITTLGMAEKIIAYVKEKPWEQL